jgi:hypothetical protein
MFLASEVGLKPWRSSFAARITVSLVAPPALKTATRESSARQRLSTSGSYRST